MSGLFYNFGRMAGPLFRKAKWAWLSATGTEAEAVQAEYETGRDLAIAIRRQLPPDKEPQAMQFLGEIGDRISKRVANKHRKFSFEPVGSSMPNAFALPGGFIFVSRSLLELCEWNQDEIAFVLGHEMSHVIRGHAMARIIRNSVITFGAKALPVGGLAGELLRTAGVKFFQSAYSQENELEADTLAILLADTAGYDAIAAIPMLSRLAKLNNPSIETGLEAYFSSHPALEMRIQNAGCVLRQR